MNILMMTRSLPFHQVGGMEAVAWDVAQGLAEKGCKVRVLTTACPSLPAVSEYSSVTIECLPTVSGRYSKGWWVRSRQVFEERLVSETDIVLSISAAGLAAARGRKPGTRPHFLVQTHGTAWGEIVSKINSGDLRAWARALYNLKSMWTDTGYRNFDGFIAVGEKVQADLRRTPTKWITGDMPIHLIRNGVRPDLFGFDNASRGKVRGRLGWTGAHRVVISSSRLLAEKGVAESIAAFARAANADPMLRYMIVGSGAQADELVRNVEARGLGDSVKFIGRVAREEMGHYLSAADVFLFTTLRMEGLPLNLLEALAAGLPCIVSRHVSGPQLDTIAVDPHDEDGVAKAISDAARQTQVPRQTRLADCFTLDHAVDEYVALFQDYMSRGAA